MSLSGLALGINQLNNLQSGHWVFRRCVIAISILCCLSYTASFKLNT